MKPDLNFLKVILSGILPDGGIFAYTDICEVDDVILELLSIGLKV